MVPPQQKHPGSLTAHSWEESELPGNALQAAAPNQQGVGVGGEKPHFLACPWDWTPAVHSTSPLSHTPYLASFFSACPPSFFSHHLPNKWYNPKSLFQGFFQLKRMQTKPVSQFEVLWLPATFFKTSFAFDSYIKLQIFTPEEDGRIYPLKNFRTRGLSKAFSQVDRKTS